MYDKNLLLHQVLKIVHFSIPIPNSEFVLCRMNINIPENFGNNTVIHTTLTHVWKSDIKFLLRTFKSSFNVINILLSWLCFISEQEFPANLWLLWSNSWTKFSLDKISFPAKFSLDRISFPTPEVIFFQRDKILVRRKFLPEKII